MLIYLLSIAWFTPTNVTSSFLAPTLLYGSFTSNLCIYLVIVTMGNIICWILNNQILRYIYMGNTEMDTLGKCMLFTSHQIFESPLLARHCAGIEATFI